jgi:ubiquinone/menaquinone biosynthesis C-methylase UbiE
LGRVVLIAYCAGVGDALDRVRRLFTAVQPLSWGSAGKPWREGPADDPRRAPIVGTIVDGLLARGAEPGDRVLDLGCGTGTYALELARRDLSVVAVDESRAMLRRARVHAARQHLEALTFARSDLDRPLPIATADVDHAICVSALESATRPERVVQEMVRVVRPGGILCLAGSARAGSPAGHPGPERRRFLRAPQAPVEPAPIVRHFEVADFVAILADSGAEEVRVKQANGYLVATARR